MPSPPPRRLAANLDAEEHWARLEPRFADHPGPRPARPPLARAAIEAAAGFGTLMRVLARPEDRLHTLAPVDPERLVPIDGVPCEEVAEVVLESGAVDDDLPVLPWAWAPPWAGPSGDDAARAEVAARVNDRRFGLELARELGVADPLARCFDGPEALAEHLDGPAADIRQWVLKAPFSTAGRSRFVHRPEPSEAPADVRQLIRPPAIRRLFRQHGSLVFEPWHRRTLDLGLLFEIMEGDPGKWRRTTARLHRLHVDALGRFRGIELDPSEPWLDRDQWDEHRRRLEEVADGVGRALGEAGYRGPVGVDLWLHQAEGSEDPLLHPLGEINARLSFGWLARAWARALGTEKGRLILGSRPEVEKDGDGAQLRTLLRPDSAGRGGAWFVVPGSAID
jgi:hypothetical protein